MPSTRVLITAYSNRNEAISVKEKLASSPFQQVIQKIDPQARLLREWMLKGGVSAQVTAIKFERANGKIETVVIRQHGAVDLAHNPHIATDEFKLLNILHTGGIKVPLPYFADESCEILPSPYIVIVFIEGETVFAPSDISSYVTQAADQLSRLHRTYWAGINFLTTPDYSTWFRDRPAKLDDSIGEGQIRDVLEAGWGSITNNPMTLLHGDYWPGNLLWKDEQLVAVIDWEDAAHGDPLQDLAKARLELLWALGDDAMHQFTNTYLQLTTLDSRSLPYWDLCAALRPAFKLSAWVDDAAEQQIMRDKLRTFAVQAIAKIGNDES